MKVCTFIIQTAQCWNVSSGICGQQRPRSDCASAQSDLGLHCPPRESFGNIECINGEQTPEWNCVPGRMMWLCKCLHAWCVPWNTGFSVCLFTKLFPLKTYRGTCQHLPLNYSHSSVSALFPITQCHLQSIFVPSQRWGLSVYSGLSVPIFNFDTVFSLVPE